MGTKEKLIERFKRQPKDFTFEEMFKLLIGFGYTISNKGKTSGSRIRFINKVTKSVIDMHKPHPSNIMNEGVIGTVEYNAANNCLFGKVEGMVKDSITYEGQSITDLKTDFENAIDSYLEGCEELGIKPRKAYSGMLNIRIPSEIHCQIAMKAKQTGRSINAIIKDALENQLNLSH